MKPWRPSDVEPLLARLDLKPSRVLGQNFLVDANILRVILDEAGVGPEDTVLEVGAGLGVLTAPLLEHAARVIAIEKDTRLWRHLDESLGTAPNLELIHADALDLDLPALLAAGVTRVVSNLPYSVAGRILVEIAAAAARPARMVVTVQREVAYRMAAEPGTSEYGLLSVLLQLPYEVAVRKIIRPTCFLPRPKVDSALVRMDRRPAPAGEVTEGLLALLHHAFSQRRKQMANILRHAPPGVPGAGADAGPALAALGISPAARPGELAPGTWVALADALAPPGAPSSP